MSRLSPQMRFTPLLAVLVAALALYVSRGVLDQVATSDGLVRVALLPPLHSLGGFVALVSLGLLWLDRRAVPRGTATAVRPPLGPLLLPLFGLAVLLVPYMPVVADAVPALQMIAGPLGAVVWLVVLAQQVWVLWQARLLKADWLQRWTLRRSALVIGAVTAALSGLAASRLVGTTLFPAGDEPHYLIIAQSLWRDGDLKIENNHARRDYGEYYPLDLDPHYLTRGADGEIYSIHPVGMPVLIAPVYAAGGYRAVVAFLVLMAAAAAALVWHAVVRATNAPGAATFAVVAVVATTPFLFNSFAVYPEIPAALAAVTSLTLTFGGAGPRTPISRWLLVGLSCAALPWLSTKYAPMSAALVVIALGRIIWPRVPEPSALASVFRAAFSRSHLLGTAAAVVGPYLASLAAWFWLFAAIWGSPRPQAPYGALVQTRPFNLIFGAPGLLFDQEYGLLPYAPVYILAVTGLWVMWRQGGDTRRRGIEVALTFGALLATVGAFRIWWGVSASPGRPLTSALLLLAFPIAMTFGAAAAGSARRAAHHLLLWTSVGIAGIMLVAQNGFLLSNGRDGTSALLEYLSPRWPAWTVAPSFIHHEAPTALLHSLTWLALAALAAVVLGRVRPARPGNASLWAMSTCAGAVLLAILLFPWLPADPPWPAIDVAARSRLPLLDAYDAVARPQGLEYTPLRFASAADVSAHAALAVEPGRRADPQPIRVLHNGRFSLPAGRYRVDVTWDGTRMSDTIGLQIGRTGETWRTWPVEPRPGERWSAEFTIPVDASFVGLRGTPELERVIQRISLTPVAIVNRGERPRLPTVIGASQSGGSSVFYYDANAFAEPNGFWVRGGTRTTRVTIERPTKDGPLLLLVHSGLVANRLRIATHGWRQTIALERELPQQVEIPVANRTLVTLELTAEAAFVPKEVDPASRDARPLGVWVEVMKP